MKHESRREILKMKWNISGDEGESREWMLSKSVIYVYENSHMKLTTMWLEYNANKLKLWK